jgi:Sap, sulfolipid-1-addressing protein
MSQLSKQNLPTAATVIAVIAFNMIMLLLLELPLLGYAIRPDATAAAIGLFTGWLSRNGGRAALLVTTAAGSILIARGVINW